MAPLPLRYSPQALSSCYTHHIQVFKQSPFLTGGFHPCFTICRGAAWSTHKGAEVQFVALLAQTEISILSLEGRRQCWRSQQDLSPPRQHWRVSPATIPPSTSRSHGHARDRTEPSAQQAQRPSSCPSSPSAQLTVLCPAACLTPACQGCTLDPTLPLSVQDHLLRNPQDFLSPFPFTAGFWSCS